MRESTINLTGKEWVNLFSILLGIKLVYFLIFFYAHHYLPRAEYQTDIWMTRADTRLRENLANFDGAWFVRIAKLGYQKLTSGDYNLEQEIKNLRVIDQLGYQDGVARKFAYRHWPLFPWMIKILGKFLQERFLIAGIILSNLFYFLYGIFFYLLARQYFSSSVSLLALGFALIHPGAYSLSAVYNEPVFLFFICAGFYFLKREKYLWAGIFGALASLTRIEAVLVYLPIIYEYFRKTAPEKDSFWAPLSGKNLQLGFSRLLKEPRVNWLFLIPLGSILVLLYFKHISGDAFVFVQVHEANIYGHFGFPWQMLYATYLKGADTYLKEFPLHGLLLLVIIFSWKKVDWSLWVWMVAFWLFYTTNGNHSYLRYQVMCIPMFLALGRLLENQEVLKYLYMIASAGAMSFFSAMFINGYWVA